MYDFLLVSQKVRQGTVTPVHYNIIYDTTKLGPDKFQRLSYKLTHLYFNWPGTVRVPAPCQYAHKLGTKFSKFSKTNYYFSNAGRRSSTPRSSGYRFMSNPLLSVKIAHRRVSMDNFFYHISCL